MKDTGLVGLAIYFGMIYAIFYFASKGWQRGK